MSSEIKVRILDAVSPRFPGEGSSSQGQPGAKARAKAVADAQRVDIPVPCHTAITNGATEKGSRAGFWTSP